MAKIGWRMAGYSSAQDKDTVDETIRMSRVAWDQPHMNRQEAKAS